MDCFEGYTAFYNQFYLTNNIEEMNNTNAYQCERFCSNNISCGGFNFLPKQSQCILLITDTISLSGLRQEEFSVFFMQSFNNCDDFFISPFYIVFMIIVVLILGICCWNSCFRRERIFLQRRTDSHTHLIEDPSPQIPPPYQAREEGTETAPVPAPDPASPSSIPNSPPPPI